MNDEEWSVIVNRSGDGYGVFRFNEVHKRPHLWRVENDNRYHSIATFRDEEEAVRFLRWMKRFVSE